jgi:hypothetical protein
MNGSFRGLYSQIRRQWIRKLHDKATVDKLNANAVSNEVRGPMDPTRVKKWNPWRSPFMWTIGFIPFFTFGLGTWQVRLRILFFSSSEPPFGNISFCYICYSRLSPNILLRMVAIDQETAMEKRFNQRCRRRAC